MYSQPVNVYKQISKMRNTEQYKQVSKMLNTDKQKA